MDVKTEQLIQQLAETHSLPLADYEYVIAYADQEAAELLAQHAVAVRKKIYGTDVFTRGLIELTSYCKNDCYYCGLRVSNTTCERYRLTEEDILSSAAMGYKLGFRTFVLQGGEDPHFTDEKVAHIVRALKQQFPDCAVTLSLGERSYEGYAMLKEAGADRYLLRHETADEEHYKLLHPDNMHFSERMKRIGWLRELGFAVGIGFMVASPGQSTSSLAADLHFIEQFKPEMCGIGPFIPHHATPFADKSAGTLEQTCLLLSMIRLIHPPILLPATTALGTIDPQGRERGIQAGANVVMPNLSPVDVRSKYLLYDGKASTGLESAEGWNDLAKRMEAIGYNLAVDRGDPRQ